MSYPLCSIEKAGILTSIQDLGRFGYQHYGVPISGAMDKVALQIGNGLVGNDLGAACLEVTMGGTTLKASHDHLVAITGADLDAKLNGKKAPLWSTFIWRKGTTLTFKGPVEGIRAYIAVQGGIDSESILGSQSVYERGQMGRHIQSGDQLYSYSNQVDRKRIGLSHDKRPSYDKEVDVRLVGSQHQSYIKKESIEAFFNTSYTVSTGDRMGIQLDGEAMTFEDTGDIISEAVTFGTVQVPSSGMPVILMADSQTTGGYVTIGNIVRADLWKIAQLPPGGKINFHKISHEEARKLSKNLHSFLSSLQKEAKYIPSK
ncbi:biotin-dependent carboxyltransferase family protein [Pontibacillus salipaludis]|uniref:Urea carboxylase n=1 Tax=Pontibacillus salipaludis TaxID=1697394 RepID=A0ABQ1PQ92_9BACI|nr:biotin-dependent carboxyltransferase family protein [Pontibacillus salipaludis]GGD01147.1 urea carboxylase [Pontibacillus salipaludis]